MQHDGSSLSVGAARSASVLQDGGRVAGRGALDSVGEVFASAYAAAAGFVIGGLEGWTDRRAEHRSAHLAASRRRRGTTGVKN